MAAVGAAFVFEVVSSAIPSSESKSRRNPVTIPSSEDESRRNPVTIPSSEPVSEPLR